MCLPLVTFKVLIITEFPNHHCRTLKVILASNFVRFDMMTIFSLLVWKKGKYVTVQLFHLLATSKPFYFNFNWHRWSHWDTQTHLQERPVYLLTLSICVVLCCTGTMHFFLSSCKLPVSGLCTCHVMTGSQFSVRLGTFDSLLSPYYQNYQKGYNAKKKNLKKAEFGDRCLWCWV